MINAALSKINQLARVHTLSNANGIRFQSSLLFPLWNARCRLPSWR